MKKRIFISFAILVFLLVAVVATVILTQQKQELRKGAAGERVDISFAPPSNPVSLAPNTEFTVDVVAAPSSGAKATAITVVVNFPSYLTLLSLTPGPFFSFPANTEMMALGVSCAAVSDCRTTATGVTCTGGFCKTKDSNNAVYPPNNTSTQLQFTLGAACTNTTGTGGQCYPQTASGVLATIKFKSGSAASGGNIAFNSGTQVAGLDSGGNAITANIGFTGSAVPVNVTGGATPTPPPASPSPNTASPTPPVSVPPGTATLNFKIKFQGITSQKADKQVKVTLKNGPAFDNVNVVSDGGDVYSGSVTNIPAGTYEVLIKGPVNLQKNFGSVTFSTDQTVDKDWSGTILKAGDIDKNNFINAVDVAKLLQDYFPNTPAGSVADFNLDGTVNAVDIGFLIGNYFQTGDQ